MLVTSIPDEFWNEINVSPLQYELNTPQVPAVMLAPAARNTEHEEDAPSTLESYSAHLNTFGGFGGGGTGGGGLS